MKGFFFRFAAASRACASLLFVCASLTLATANPQAIAVHLQQPSVSAAEDISGQTTTVPAGTALGLKVHLAHGGSFDARSVSIHNNAVTLLLAQPDGGEITLTPERIAYTEFAADALWPQFFQRQASGDSNGAHQLFATMYRSYQEAMPLVSAATLERLSLAAENALQANQPFFAIAVARHVSRQATARQLPELAARLADTQMIALWHLQLFAEAEALATQAIANNNTPASALATPGSALPYALKAAGELANGNAEAALATALHPIVLTNALHSPRHLDAAYAVALLACEALEQPQTAKHLRNQAAHRNALPTQASFHARALAPALFNPAQQSNATTATQTPETTPPVPTVPAAIAPQQLYHSNPH